MIPGASVPAPSAEFSSFALFDVVRNWYFLKHDLVLAAFDEVISEGPNPNVRAFLKFRAHTITLFKALKQKMKRQDKNLSEDEKTLIKNVETILKSPLETSELEGKTTKEQLNFWNQVVDLEINLLDMVGITKIDSEKRDAMERYMKAMFNG